MFINNNVVQLNTLGDDDVAIVNVNKLNLSNLLTKLLYLLESSCYMITKNSCNKSKNAMYP